MAARFVTAVIALAASIVATLTPTGGLHVVILAWSSPSSAFVPLVLVYALRGKPSEMQSLMMVAGRLAAALWWRSAGLNAMIPTRVCRASRPGSASTR